MVNFARLLQQFNPKKIFVVSTGLRTTFRSFTEVGVNFSRSSTMSTPGIAKVWDEGQIVKSAGDKRVYRGLQLTNGIKALLISDPTTDKASASMNVHIGHMSDPRDLPGLAHFCEHMLFLGTEKYPQENEYSKFLSEHAGSSNAFTSAENTNYYFDVAPEELDGALDRFAQFFLCPLFTATATEREVNAVNSENDKNLQSDPWRLMQLEKSTSNPNHDYSKFGTGNKYTLETKPQEMGLNTRDELLKFHSKYYSSNIMALCILGKDSLDDLGEKVVKLFSDVPNKNAVVPEWPEHPYGPNELKLRANVVPIKDIRNLNLTWPLPDLHQYYHTQPGHYLGHLVGHEGPGSLLSELKNRGWVNTLVGGSQSGAKGFEFFILNVDLTEEGIEHIDDIVTLVFQYFNLLRKEGAKEWIFNECRDLTAMTFRFKDKEKPRNYTVGLANCIHDFPMEEVLSGGYVMSDYNPELINSILEKLTPDNVRIAAIGQKYQGTTDKVEEWYKTEHSIEHISNDTIQKWKDAGLHDKLHLPLPNDFIPTNFDIVPREEEATTPSIIKDTPMGRLWFKQDDKFLLPKACVSIELTSPKTYVDPLHANFTHMFVSLFKDALNEYTYAAELAGLHYSLDSTIYGIFLSLSGYSDKQSTLLQKIMDILTSFRIDPQRYEIIKESYIRSLQNFRAEQPHQHAIYYTSMLMSEAYWTKEELLEAIDEVTLEGLRAFIPQLLSRMFIECLVYGNMTKNQALDIQNIVENTLIGKSKTKPLLPSQRKRLREVQLPDGSCHIYKKTNNVHKSSSIEIYYQTSTQSTENNIMLELFCQIISEPCFDILRTQEQLGYIVFSGPRRSSGVQGLRVIVQSDKSPEYVENRIEAFLWAMEKYICDMTDEIFKKHATALGAHRLEKPKKLSSQNNKYWSEIACQQYNFNRDNIEVAHLKSLTKDDVVKFYKELISPAAPKRRKVCVHVLSTAPGHVPQGSADTTDGLSEVPPLPEATVIYEETEFKKAHGLFPLAKPFVDIKTLTAKSKL
ncbi:unnamed protein product [Owenia fusiformis]|uniref:Insulin-degrading enzyme n=1 Tax=Owenia fusiformis TaxID=6347 RepID=A0A8J1T691_OWEFU|nr:unnamed protein product [Owenia fusiformis]